MPRFATSAERAEDAPEAPEAHGPSPPPRIAGPVRRLHLLQSDRRLGLNSRGPVARRVLPVLNAVPAGYLVLNLGFAALLAWSAASGRSTAPPPTGGTLAVLLVVGVSATLLPLLLWLALLAGLGVGEGFSLTLDSETRRCRIRRARIGLPPVREEGDLDDARFGLLDGADVGTGGGTGGGQRRRGFGPGLLTLLTLVNPLFFLVQMAFRRRNADIDLHASAVTRLRIDTGEPGSPGWLLIATDADAVRDLLVRWAAARRDRFRFGFADAGPLNRTQR